MRFILLLYLQVFVSYACENLYAQTTRIDSLKKRCYADISAQEKTDAFLQLLGESESMSFETLSKVINDAEPFVNASNKPYSICKFAYSKAKYDTYRGKADSAKIMVAAILNRFKDTPGIKRELRLLEYTLARIEIFNGKIQEGIAGLLALMKKIEVENPFDKKVWSYCVNSIGYCYMDMGRDEEAINWFRKAIELTLLPLEQFDQSSIYGNMASCLNNVMKSDSALRYINISIQLAKKAQNLTTLANGLNIKADILITKKQEKMAEPLLLEAINIRKQIGNANYIASDMAQLALYYGKIGEYDKGIELANQALIIYKNNQLSAKSMFAYEALKLNYFNKGDYKRSTEVLEKMLQLKDSLYTSNSAESLTALQTRYEVQKKETLIAQQKLTLLRRSLLLYSGAIAGLLVTIFAAYRFRRYQQKQKQLLEERNRMNLQAIKDAEEKERKRIAAELHDNLGVQANAILHNTNLLSRTEPNNTAMVADLQETAKEMLHNLRETLWAMKAADVTTNAIWLRIINFMKQMGRHYGNIQFKINGTTPQLLSITSSKALHIVLVLQECVNNSVKHAAAQSITVNSSIEDNAWVIRIIDDGIGFNLDNKELLSDHYGLDNMHQRAKDGGFILKIDTAPGSGTTTILII